MILPVLVCMGWCSSVGGGVHGLQPPQVPLRFRRVHPSRYGVSSLSIGVVGRLCNRPTFLIRRHRFSGPTTARVTCRAGLGVVLVPNGAFCITLLCLVLLRYPYSCSALAMADEVAWKACFNMFDTTRTGELSKEDYLHCLRACGQRPTQKVSMCASLKLLANP